MFIISGDMDHFRYRCTYCDVSFNEHGLIVEHLISSHHWEILSFRELCLSEVTGKTGYLKKTYEGIMPRDIIQQGKLVHSVDGQIVVALKQSEHTPHSYDLLPAHNDCTHHESLFWVQLELYSE